MCQSTFFKPKEPHKIEDEKKIRKLPPLSQTTPEDKRIVSALKWVKKPFHFKLEELNEKSLAKIARKTNGATIHFSGNCTVLAFSLLYNLLTNKTELKGTNTYPIYRPVNSEQAEQIILGKKATPIKWGISEIEKFAPEILSRFKSSGERFFLVAMNYLIFGKPGGHIFNAVVVGEKEHARVIFVDAWNTLTSPIDSPESLVKKYRKKKFLAIIYSSPDSIAQLENPLHLDKENLKFVRKL